MRDHDAGLRADERNLGMGPRECRHSEELSPIRAKEGDKITRCPSNIGVQIPPLTYSSSDTDSRSSHEGTELSHQQVVMDDEAYEETKKGYNTHMVVIGSEEANLVDDNNDSITGDMRDGDAKDEHTDRTSLLKDDWG